eukprot:gene19856-21796_t
MADCHYHMHGEMENAMRRCDATDFGEKLRSAFHHSVKPLQTFEQENGNGAKDKLAGNNEPTIQRV